MPLSRFRHDVPALAPPHLQGPNMDTMLGAIGTQLDANAEQVMWSRLQAIPFAGGANVTRELAARLADGRLLECEDFVLPILAEQRGIPLYDTESELSKRIRVSQWLELRRRKGTQLGELQHVRPYFSGAPFAGYPVLEMVHQSGNGHAIWHRLDAAGVYSLHRASNFDYDGQTAKWSRVWAFVHMTGTGIAGPPLYGDGHLYGDGTLYGSVGLSVEQHRDIVKLFQDWTAAHEWLAGVALVWTAGAVDRTSTPTQDGDGRWSLPNGANTWSVLADPATGKATRPTGVQWIFDNPA